MSKNTAQVNVTIKSEALQVSTPGTGIAFVAGWTEKGPDNADDLIASWNRFMEVFGGETINSPFATNVKQTLAAGGKVRVCRALGTGATIASGTTITDGTNNLFTFDSKYKGDYYNRLHITIAAASDGNADHFNVEVWGPQYGQTSTIVRLELYKNIVAPTGGDAAPYTYLSEVENNSEYVSVTYEDVSGLAGTLNPVEGDYTFSGGTDGAQPTAAEIGTQLVVFDDYVDGWILACPGLTESTTTGLNAVCKSYVEAREDIAYLESIDNEFITAANIISEIEGLGNSSKYCGFIVGGAKELGYDGYAAEMTGMGDVLGTILSSHNTNGVWVSPTAFASGGLKNAFGVVNNFGAPSKLSDRNLIANAGGNCIVHKSGKIMLWDFYSMADEALPEKFLNIVLLQTYIKRAVIPTLERYLNKPNIFSTWKAIWGSVKPFFDGLVADEALFNYSWEGDQFAVSLDELQVNNKADVLAGLYKVRLNLTTVAPLVEFTLEITMNQDSGEVTVG